MTMPFLAPVLDLLIGLCLRLLVALVVAAARLAWRVASSAVTEHPGLSFLGVLVAQREGWIASPWVPFLLAGLGVLAIVRFFTAHPPAEVARRAQREARRTYEAGAAVTTTARKAARWATDKARKPHRGGDDLPPPPRTVATDQATDWKGEPLDDAGRRLHAYRENGYRGWLDWDGHPVDHDGTRITARTDAGERIIADIDAIPMGPAQGVKADA